MTEPPPADDSWLKMEYLEKPAPRADIDLMANPEGDKRILDRARELGQQFNERSKPKPPRPPNKSRRST